MKLFIMDHSAALVLCARGSAQKLLAPFSRQRVFLLKDSGFIRSSRVTDASWLRLVPSLLHEHLRGCNLNHTSIGHLWHPLFDNLFVMTMFINVFLLKDSGFIWSSQVTNASWFCLVPSLLPVHLGVWMQITQVWVAYGTLCLLTCLGKIKDFP